MFFIRMALKNVFRQYGRTALSMVSIIAGVAVLILSRGLTGGFKENIIHAQVNNMSGHVMAMPAGYPTSGMQAPVDELLVVDGAVRTWLDHNSVAWTERVIFAPRAIVGADAMRVRAFGFDPVKDEAVFPRTDWRVDGAIPKGANDGVLVGSGVAKVFKLKPGDHMVLETRTTAGAINAMDVAVSGVVSTGAPIIDRIGLFVSSDLVQELVRNGSGVTHLALRLEDRETADVVAAGLLAQLGAQARVTTWKEETAGLLEVQDMRQVMLDILALAMVAIAATGIANTVLMAAYERIKEIGTLRAMGMTRQGVMRLFLTEGLVMGAVGSALGGLLGGLMTSRYSKVGIDLTSFIAKTAENASSSQNVPFSTMLYLSFSETTIAGAMIFGLLVAVIASIYPAKIAADMSPADAVRAD